MMRDKRRYILVESAEGIAGAEQDAFAEALYGELLKAVGEINYPSVNPKIMKFVDGKRFIIRSSLSGQDTLVLALSLIKSLNGNETAFYTLKSSGTIKTLDDLTENTV